MASNAKFGILEGVMHGRSNAGWTGSIRMVIIFLNPANNVLNISISVDVRRVGGSALHLLGIHFHVKNVV
jgi:hypothetical protein